MANTGRNGLSIISHFSLIFLLDRRKNKHATSSGFNLYQRHHVFLRIVLCVEKKENAVCHGGCLMPSVSTQKWKVTNLEIRWSITTRVRNNSSGDNLI